MISSRQILAESEAGDPFVAGGHNLLVVSDLHLGDSLRPTDPGYLKHIARLNRALSRFLRHYALHTVNGRPWRLVIAGDMIDFLHAGLYEGSGTPQVRPGRREGVSASSETAATAWLEEVMVRERRVFRLLASFVGAGHQLVIIKGNHDAQFHFESVQRRFVELLLGFHLSRSVLRRKHSSPEAIQKEMRAFKNRIHFSRWFYYERDVVYIEHGNQYDPFCSFEHVLSPVDPDLYELEDPISHRTYREFASVIGDLDVHLIDQWRLFDYVKWVVSMGPRMIGRLAYTYFASISWLMNTKRRLLNAARKARDEHLKRRSLLSGRWGLPEETLHALDELRAGPAGKSVFAGINMLYMDRVALAMVNVLALAAAALSPGSVWLRAGIVAGVGLLSLLAHKLLERFRDSSISPHPRLIRMAKKIARLVKVPFVVFGHSHIPAAVSAEAEHSDAWYFNTGSWTSASAANGLTHVCILIDEEKPKAELRRWCPDSNKPLPMKVPAMAGG